MPLLRSLALTNTIVYPCCKQWKHKAKIQRLFEQIDRNIIFGKIYYFSLPPTPTLCLFGTAAVSSRMQLCICYLITYLWIHYESLGDVLQCTQDDISCEKSLSQAHTPMNTGTQGPRLAIKVTFKSTTSSALQFLQVSPESITETLVLELFSLRVLLAA